MVTKQCRKCEERKPLDEFYDHKGAKDGKQGTCRVCRRRENRDRNRARYHNDSEYRQRCVTREAQRRERGDAWAWAYAYRCKEAGVSPVIEPFSRQDVIDRYSDHCAYCDTGEFEHLDHYVPVSQGGPHTLENVRPSCAKCNLAKWSSDPLEFAASSMAVDDPDEVDSTSALEPA